MCIRDSCCSTRTISSTISRSFVKRQRKRPGRIVSSDRVIPSHLIGSYRLIWSRSLNADTPSEQFIALLVIVRRRSQISSFQAGRSCFVVNVRLTARLQSLPLARCWPACFALFSSFFPLLFRLTLTVVNWLYVGCVPEIIIQNELYVLFVWRLIAKILYSCLICCIFRFDNNFITTVWYSFE